MTSTGRYLVAKDWVHCFVGSQKSYADWVLDLEGEVLVCDFPNCGGRRQALAARELACLQEDVEHNVLSSIAEGTFDAEDQGLRFADDLPSWARVRN